MIGIFQQNNNQVSSKSEFLPTPKIAVKGTGDNGFYRVVDRYSWKNISISGVLSTSYTDDYYKVYFDVYVDSIGSNEWLNLPNVRLELLKVTNNKQGGWNPSNPKNIMGNIVSTPNNSQKDFNRTIIVKSEAIQPNSWAFPDLTPGNVTTNKLSTPSLRVEVDLRNYFAKSGNSWGTSPLFPINSNSGVRIRTRGLGASTPKNGVNLKDYYIRNMVLYFRLSSTDGDKKIYSDLSIPIYLQPQVRKFYNTPNDDSSGSDSIIYHYKIGLGNKV